MLLQCKLSMQAAVLAVFMSCIVNAACGQNTAFKYMSVNNAKANMSVPVNLMQAQRLAAQDGVSAIKYLPVGYVRDGSVDYTAFIQQALNDNASVIMPNFTVLVNDTGLTLHTGQTVVFPSGARLRLKPSSLDNYEILRIHGVSDVNIYSPIIEGDKFTHTGTTGQWGMGISIRASSNVTVVKPQISVCWGDGIYIGSENGQGCSNIKIYSALLDNNRRNGMSITSASGVTVSGGVVSNTSGQNPMSGIDVEPNRSTDVIDDITIANVTTFNNASYGVVLSLQHLLGRTQGSTNIKVLKMTDSLSSIGFGMIGKPDARTLSGSINVISPRLLYNKVMPARLPFRTYVMQTRFIDPEVQPTTSNYNSERLKTLLKNSKEKIIVE